MAKLEFDKVIGQMAMASQELQAFFTSFEPVISAQDTAYPLAQYALLNTPPLGQDLSGNIGIRDYAIRIDIWAKRYADVRRGAKLVYDVYHGIVQTEHFGVLIQNSRLETEVDTGEYDPSGGGKIFHRVHDYSFIVSDSD